MAAKYNVAGRVKVADDSSNFRNKQGTVMAVSTDTVSGHFAYDVRLDGFGKVQTERFLEPQLQTEPNAAPLDYTH